MPDEAGAWASVWESFQNFLTTWRALKALNDRAESDTGISVEELTSARNRMDDATEDFERASAAFGAWLDTKA